MLCTEYNRPVIKIGPKGALGSHEISPIHSAPSLGQSIPKYLYLHKQHFVSRTAEKMRTGLVEALSRKGCALARLQASKAEPDSAITQTLDEIWQEIIKYVDANDTKVSFVFFRLLKLPMLDTVISLPWTAIFHPHPHKSVLFCNRGIQISNHQTIICKYMQIFLEAYVISVFLGNSLGIL